MIAASNHLPDDKDALKAALIEARAKLSGAEALIEHLQLVIAKMKREMFGPRSERSQRLIDQLELQLEELAAERGEAAAKAEAAGDRGCGIYAASSDGVGTFPITCRAGALFMRRQRRARAAVAPGCRRSARTSPRPSMSCRGNGS